MSRLNDDSVERARVFSRIAPVIAEFHDVTGEQEFHVEDLRRYVLLRVPEVAPDSPGRILRELRLRRHLDYVVINRRLSLYRFVTQMDEDSMTSAHGWPPQTWNGKKWVYDEPPPKKRAASPETFTEEERAAARQIHAPPPDELPSPRMRLRGYQQRAATYLYEHDAAFLIAPLGAGKGAAAVTAADELIHDRHARHALVVAPKLVAATVWPVEASTWTPRLGGASVLDGDPAQRRALLRRAGEKRLTTVGIDLVQWLVEDLAELPDDHPVFDILIIDETSRLKDPTGKRSRALLKIAHRFKIRWGLTGTPRPNSSLDLFMPAAIITDGKLWGRAFIPWRNQHFKARDPWQRDWKPLPGAEAQIAAEFGTVAMIVADEDMPDLPPLNVVETLIQLPPEAMAIYQKMENEMFAAIAGKSIEAASPMITTGKCAQIANGFIYEAGGNAVPVHDLKIEWLHDLVETLDGEPLLIAYEFIADVAAIRAALGDVPVLGSGTSSAEANRLVAAWNAGTLPLLAFHPASAGHGLNLQHGGSRMAWMSPSWSAELTEQAIARIYRPGQAKHVTIHVCIAAGTVDEMKRDRVLGKMSAQEAFKRYLERV